MSKQGIISIGIDIGGTKINAAAVSNGMIISEVLSYKTPDNIKDLINIVFEAIEELKNQYKAEFVGIATAGTVNLENTKVTGSTGNLPKGYGGLELKKMIEEKFGIKTFVENDANAAAYAEYKVGNARGDENVIMLTLGTGIGGGIIVNGELLRGKSGVGAECGHMAISWEKRRRCTCGAWDCWEAYASGTGYALNARDMAQEISPDKRKGLLLDKNPTELTTHDIIDSLRKKDPFAKKVHERWEDYLAIGIAALVNIFDPDSVILSGGMAKFINFEKLSKKIEKRTVISKIKLLPAKTENYAGIIGAAILAEEKLMTFVT